MFERWEDRHPLAAQLAAMETGVPLASALVDRDPSLLDDPSLLEVVAGWERLIAWASAAQSTALAEMSRRATVSRDGDFCADDVAARLGTSRRAAELKVELAQALQAAPAVHRALACGAIDVRKATVLTQETAHLSADDAIAIQERLLPSASEATAPQLRAAVRRADISLDPTASEKRHERARAERSVTLTPAPCSMAWLTAYLPADDAMRVLTAVDAIAATCAPEDERCIDARRADALVDIMSGVLDTGIGPDGPLPIRQHRRPHLLVTAAATTLLGLDDSPATLAGYGPIPASMARQIGAVSTWRPVLTHAESGELVGRSSRSYRPSVAVAGMVVDRDVTCTFPGCRVAAMRCDIDHIRPFSPDRPAETQTHVDNLHALCRHHHRLKTHGRWRPVRDPATGRTHWESGTGHTYTRDPVPTDPTDRPPRTARPPIDEHVARRLPPSPEPRPSAEPRPSPEPRPSAEPPPSPEPRPSAEPPPSPEPRPSSPPPPSAQPRPSAAPPRSSPPPQGTPDAPPF